MWELLREQDGSGVIVYNDDDEDGYCNGSGIDPEEIVGCQDETACNYDSSATDDDGSCTYPLETYLDCDETCLNDSDGDSVCDEIEIYGCTQEWADNYSEQATENDETCYLYGCSYPNAINYDPNVTHIDGSCIFKIEGCMDESAYNYDDEAQLDDGSCYPIIQGCMTPWADNFIPLTGNQLIDVNTDNGSCFKEGCSDVTACNMRIVTDDDNSCSYANAGYDCDGVCILDTDGDEVCDEFEISGCTDATACNYDVSATDDDGTAIIMI